MGSHIQCRFLGLLLLASTLVNCSQAEFSSPVASKSSSSSSGGTNSGIDTGPGGSVSGSTGTQPGGGTGSSVASQPGGGGPASGTVSAPVAFSATNCTLKYPYNSTVPATSVNFSEPVVLVAFSPTTTVTVSAGLTINLWYGDEHAMLLGVREVQVIPANGGPAVVTDYATSVLTQSADATQCTSPNNAASCGSAGTVGTVVSPNVGSLNITGDQAGVDTSVCTAAAEDSCSRPMFPAMFISDITSNSANIAGDWQFGGLPIVPSAIFGTWKFATRIVDNSFSPPRASVQVDSDPIANNWNLGANIPAPTNLPILTGGVNGSPTSPAPINSAYGALVTWNVSALGLQSGHDYRLQFMVHDGDQNASGGDVGENCVDLQVP